jgi:hypothetical protein
VLERGSKEFGKEELEYELASLEHPCEVLYGELLVLSNVILANIG